MEQPAPVSPKRYLLCKSGYEVNILWLDDHGSCSRHTDSEGSVYFTRWHMKRHTDGRVYCLLCPNGLESSEWSRVFTDDPPGDWTRQFSNMREGPPKRTAVEEA